MHMKTVTELTILEQISTEGAVTVLFGSPHCSVCGSIRPELTAMLSRSFPEMRSVYVDCDTSPEICAQYRVFSLPAIKVYICGRLVVEEARVFSMVQLMQQIQRPYSMWSDSRP